MGIRVKSHFDFCHVTVGSQANSLKMKISHGTYAFIRVCVFIFFSRPAK